MRIVNGWFVIERNDDFYTADTADTEKKLLKDVNTEWQKYEIIIVSPTILYGLDFSKEHFDNVFCYTNSTIRPSSVYQQIMRIRNIKSKNVFIHYTNQYVPVAKFHETNKQKLIDTHHNYRESFIKFTSSINEGYVKHVYDMDDPFTSLYVTFLQQTNHAKNDFFTELCKCLVEYGGKCYNGYCEEIRETRRNYRNKMTEYRSEKAKFNTETQEISKYLAKYIENNDSFNNKTRKMAIRNIKDYSKKMVRENNERIKDLINIEETIIQDKLEGVKSMRNYDKTIMKDLNDERITKILVEQNKMKTMSWDSIKTVVYKSVKTEDEKYFSYAYKIMETFRLRGLSRGLLEDIGHMSYLSIFKTSLMYFMDEEELKEYINNKINGDCSVTMKNLEKIRMFDRLCKLFFTEGLLDRGVVKIRMNKNNLSDDYKVFLTNNLSKIKQLFELDRIVAPTSDYKLIHLLKYIINNLFGNMVTVSSTQKKERVNNKRIYYYNVSINATKLIELFLCSNKTVILNDSLVIRNYGNNNNCMFQVIHNCRLIKDLNKSVDEFQFD